MVIDNGVTNLVKIGEVPPGATFVFSGGVYLKLRSASLQYASSSGGGSVNAINLATGDAVAFNDTHALEMKVYKAVIAQ